MSDRPDLDDIEGVAATDAEIAACLFEGGRPAYGYVFLSVREYEMLARRALAAGPEPAHVSLCGARTRFDGHWYVCGLPDGHEAAGVRGHTGPREGMLAWES